MGNSSSDPAASTNTKSTRSTTSPSTVTKISNASGQVIFAPDPDESGTGYGSFGYQMLDRDLASAEAVVTVNVTAVNDAPTIDAIGGRTIGEDAGAQTVLLAGIGTGASNEPQALTVTATSDNTDLIPDPTVTYTSPEATGVLFH